MRNNNKTKPLVVLLIAFVALIINCSGKEQGCTLSEDECRALAQSKLQDDSNIWGEPVRIEYSGEVYTFEYSTPEGEMALLGPRSIQVDCIHGTLQYSLRE